MYVNLADVKCGRRIDGGRAVERLFWTWAPQMGWRRSISGHALLVLEECLESVVRPATFLRLCGRAWEALRWPLHRRYARKIVRPVSSAAHPIAPPHFVTAKRRRSATYE